MNIGDLFVFVNVLRDPFYPPDRQRRESSEKEGEVSPSPMP